MGICNSQQKKRIQDESFNKRCSRRTRLSDYEKNSNVERDDDLALKKRSSRLSGTRNSLILNRKNVESMIEQAQSIKIVVQNCDIGRDIIPLVYENDSFDIPQEYEQNHRKINDVYNLQTHKNNLYLVSNICVIDLQYHQTSLMNNQVSIKIENVADEQQESLNHQIRSRSYSPSSNQFNNNKQQKNRRMFLTPNYINCQESSFKNNNKLTPKCLGSKITRNKQDQIVISNILDKFQSKINLSFIQQQEINTLNLLIENIQPSILNIHSIIWYMKKLLNMEGVNLYFSNKPQLKNNQQKNQIVDFSNIYLLSSNFSQVIWELKLKENISIFRKIASQKDLKQKFIQQIEEQIKASLFQYGEKGLIHWYKMIIFKKHNQDILKLKFYLPFLSLFNQENFHSSLRRTFQSHYSSCLKSFKAKKIIQNIQINYDAFDIWGNREFKTFHSEVEIDEESGREVFPYLRPVGWKRFGLKDKEDLSEFSPKFEEKVFFQNKQSILFDSLTLAINVEVNVYLRMSQFPNKFANEDFMDLLREAIDIGPNRDSFEDAKCGIGFICCPNLNSFLPYNNQSTIPIPYRLKPIKTIVNSESRYYFLTIQAKVKKENIRIPDKFRSQIFIINDPKAIKLYGILIKEINEMEYIESIQMFK